MLDGDNEAIHTATVAQQPQVWSIKEHHYEPSWVREKIATGHASTSSSPSSPTTNMNAAREGRNGPSSWAGVSSPHNTVVLTTKSVPLGPSLTANLPPDAELVEVAAALDHHHHHVHHHPHPRYPSAETTRRSSGAMAPPSYFGDVANHDAGGGGIGSGGPMLQATYMDEVTGTRVRSSYPTWTPGSTVGTHHHPTLRDMVHADENTMMPRAIGGGGYSYDSSSGTYADPYGFCGVYASSSTMGSSGASSSSVGGGTSPVNGCARLPVSSDGINIGDLGAETGDGDDDDVRDVILTGKGHSAWGPFLLKGRVRQWDGMINIVKTYASDDGRGTWLYRGYILSNGLWVGRWRDTMTEEDTNGYEGVFAMTRRSEPLIVG